MRQIDRYLGRSLLGGAALALLALSAVDAMISLVDEVKDVDDDYTLADAALYTVLMLVAGVYELLPVAVLVGAVISLGNLAAQSELVAFRALHYSRARITASVLMTGALLMLFTFVMGETAVPAAVGKAHQIKHGPQAPQSALESAERSTERRAGESAGENVGGSAGENAGDSAEENAGGRWLRDGRHFIYIGGAAADGWHSEVSVYELNDEHHLARMMEAGRAQATADEWVLADVTLSELRGDEVSISRQERLRLPRAAPGGAGEGDVSELNPAAMNVFQLFDYVEFLRASKLSGARAELALWTRFSAALSIIVMLLLAMPWIFFSARSAGSGRRLFFAILISLAYMIGSRVIGDAAVVWEMPPVVGAFLPVALFAAAGAVLLRRLQAS